MASRSAGKPTFDRRAAARDEEKCVKSYIAAASLAMVAAPALASDWRLVTQNRDNQIFIDLESLAGSQDEVRFWYWSIRRQPATNGSRYDNLQALVRARCSERSFSLLSTSYFRHDLLVNRAGRDNAVQYASPDSLMSGSIKAACSPVDLGPTVSDPYGMAREAFAASPAE
jgi:hypothetical protein